MSESQAAWHTVVTTGPDGQPHTQQLGAAHVVENGILLEVPHGTPVTIRQLLPGAGGSVSVTYVDGRPTTDG